MRKGLTRTLILIGVVLSGSLFSGIGEVYGQEPELSCDDWSGCSVSNGFLEEFIPEIKEKGMLAENVVTLNNISNDDLVTLAGLKEDLERLKIENSPNLTDLTPLKELTKLRTIELSLDKVPDLSALAALADLKRATFTNGDYADVAFLESLSAVNRARGNIGD